MIKLQDYTPDIYYSESRDFQFIGRLFDLVLNYVKTNVDIGAYLSWYDQINRLGDITLTDPAFGFIMLIGKKLGLSYYEFLGFLGIIGLSFLYIVFRRYSKCFSVVLALYFILDFPAEIIQIRAFIAEIVMYILMMEYIGNLYIENSNKINLYHIDKP